MAIPPWLWSRLGMDQITLGEILEKWIARPGLSAETSRRERWQTGLVLAHFDADRRACTLQRDELVAWAESVKASTAPVTAERAIRFLRAAFRFGAETGLLSRNPARALSATGGRVTHVDRSTTVVG